MAKPPIKRPEVPPEEQPMPSPWSERTMISMPPPAPRDDDPPPESTVIGPPPSAQQPGQFLGKTPVSGTFIGHTPVGGTFVGPAPRGGPPQFATTHVGPPPVAATRVGPPPVAATHVGPPPVATTHVGPIPGAAAQTSVITVSGASRMPTVSNLPTAPLLRNDLVIVGETADTVTVRKSGTTTGFPIYRMEWRIAQLMDGHRSLTAIAQRAVQLGLQATPDLVRSFTRELRGYGFLADDSSAAPDKSGDLRAALAAADSDEERHLLRSALAMDRVGNDGSVAGYLEAALQINPDNEQARVALERRPAASRAPDEPLEFDIEGPEPPTADRRQTKVEPLAPAPASGGHRRIIVIATLVVTLVVAAAAFVVIRAEQRVAEHLASLGTTPSATPHEPALTAPTKSDAPTIIVQARFEPAEMTPVRTTAAGTWARSKVAVGEQVTAGAEIGALLDAKSYAKLARAEKRYNSMKESARYDEVYRYFLAQAKSSYESVERSMRFTPVTAERDGEVTSVLEPGAVVEVDQQVAMLQSRDKLKSRLAAGAVPFSVGTASCSLLDYPTLSCNLASEGDSVVVSIDDPRHVVPADNLTTIKVLAGAP